MEYRKKPVVIDAFQWKGNFEGDFPDWFNEAHDKGIVKFHLGHQYLYIDTLEGTMTAYAGDFIIRGIKGELYPCKPEIFERTYEKVEEKIDKTLCKQGDYSKDCVICSNVKACLIYRNKMEEKEKNEYYKKLATLPPSGICKEFQVQNCSFCDNLECGDNTSNNKKKINNLEKELRRKEGAMYVAMILNKMFVAEERIRELLGKNSDVELRLLNVVDNIPPSIKEVFMSKEDIEFVHNLLKEK